MQIITRVFFCLAVSTVLAFCNDSSDKKIEPTHGLTENSDEPAFKNKIIDELKNLHSVLTSKDKYRIAEIFSFPLPEENVKLFTDNPALANKIKQNKGRASKDIFLDYFETFYNSLYMDRIINVLDEVNTDSLLYINRLSKEITNNLLPCTSYYTAELNRDAVTLQFGTNTNAEYAVRDSSSEENDVDGCEFMSMWLLKFDGQKLVFNKQLSAG